jgi:hypothetical protein
MHMEVLGVLALRTAGWGFVRAIRTPLLDKIRDLCASKIAPDYLSAFPISVLIL